MPPKQRGHNTAGRDKLFRNAIEHVHVGVGYAVLGNVSLALAAGGVQESADSPNSAFFLELNELMLSNTSSDFKKFRFEVLPLCESRQLVVHHQKTIAHKLLLAIANKVQNEGFAAFLKLTIAFVRDIQARFLVFFEAFHQVVNLGIYDANNHLIPEVERVQLVFATQVAWFRELSATLVEPAYHQQVTCSVLPACIRQLSDTKDYIRRLAGETLAACCRQQRALLPLVFELAAQHIVDVGTGARPQAVEVDDAAAEDGAQLSDEDGMDNDDAADDLQGVPPTSGVSALDVEDLQQNSIVDGMTYFTADLLRGLRGSLHTNFEDVLVLVMVALNMLSPDAAVSLPNGPPLQSIMQSWMHLPTSSESGEGMDQQRLALQRMAQVVLPAAMSTLVVETRKQATDGSAAAAATPGGHQQSPIFRLLSSIDNLLGCVTSTALAQQPRSDGCWSLLLDMLREALHSANTFAIQNVHPIRTPIESIVKTLVASLSTEGSRAHRFDDALVLSKLLRLIAPLMMTSTVADATTRRWVAASVVRPLVNAIVAMTAVAGATDAQGSVMEQIIAAFFQDVVQKNRACCLSEERRGSVDSSSDEDEGSGEDDAPRRKQKMPQRDAAVFDCFLEPQTAGLLLAHACEWMIERRQSSPTAVDTALLMLLLASEKTAHALESPLEVMFAATGTERLRRSVSAFLLELLRTHSKTADATDSATRLHVVMSLMPVVLHDSTLLAQGIVQECAGVLEKDLIEPCLKHTAAVATAAELLPVASHACNVLAALAAQAMDQGSSGSSVKGKQAGKGKKGAAVLSTQSPSLTSGITWSLEALIAVVAQASHAQTSAAVAANQGLSRSIGYLLGAFGALVGRVSKRTPVASAKLLSSRIVGCLSTAGQEALSAVLIKATASSSQPLRIQALRLLKALCLEDASIDASKVRVQGCKALPAAFFDALIGAETSDPLANGGNIDDAKIHLTKVSFDANVGRVQDALQGAILLHSSFGLLHIKFAGIWPIALKMIADLLRHEASAVVTDVTTDKTPLWTAVLHEAHDIVFASAGAAPGSRGRQKRGASSASTTPSALVARGYPLSFSDQQHHEEGSLVSKAFASAKVRDQLAVMQRLASGQLCDWNVVTAALTSCPWSTDALTVAKTFLSGFEEILKHTSSPFDPKVQLVERLFVELASIDQGTHPTLSELKGLEDRLLLLMHALNVAPTSVIGANAAKHNTAWRNATPAEQQQLTHRNDTLVRILNGYLPCSNHSLQRAAVENLKRLKIVPFDPYCDQIVPFCGANMKDAFSFLSTMHVEEDISEQHRVDYIASVMVVVLPKLSQRVTKEKMKDQAVLGRRVMGLLQHTGGAAGLKRVLDRTMDHILGSSVAPASDATMGSGRALWDSYDFLGQMHTAASAGDQASSAPPAATKHWVRRFEQRIKQLTTAARVLDQFIASVGIQFAPWAHRCFVIAVQAYLFSCRSMHPGNFALPSSAMTAASTLRKVLAQSVVSLMDQFPAEVMSVVAAADAAHATKLTRFVKELFANSKTLASFGGVSNQRASQQGAGVHSSFLKMMSVWIQHSELHPLISLFGDQVLQQLSLALEVSSPGSEAVHKASSDTVYAALTFLTQVLNAANEPLAMGLGEASIALAPQTGATLGTHFVDPHLESIFETLYKLVVQGARRDDASLEEGKDAAAPARRAGNVGKRVMGFTVRMWGEVIQTVAYLSERLSGSTATPVVSARGDENVVASSKKLSTMLGQLLEIALKFVSNPLCCTDAQAVTTAASVVETLVEKVDSIHPSQHYRRMVMLFNMVTNPCARTTLCRAFRTATTKYAVALEHDGALAQYTAVARVMFGLNSFTADPKGNEDDGQQEPPQPQEDSFDRYDFERRYHCFHSLMTFFNHNGNYGALVRQRPDAVDANAAAVDEVDATPAASNRKSIKMPALPASTVRRERTYEGEQDVRIPLDKSQQPFLSTDALMAIAANLMFFLRDSERTIRSLAAQTLFAMLKYASANSASYIEACLHAIVRPIVLSSLRQGIVAKDPAIRLSHMESFGGLARYFPTYFPSFAALYSPNSERNFFINVGHAQHKCRLSALALLRKQSPNIHVRDHLRVFVPFLLVLLKDFAQGKRTEGSATVTEGRAKGYAESALMTLASLVVHMPWEGYYHVLKLLLQSANENESLRLTMLKGVVHVLQNFHFLDELDRDRAEPAALPSDSDSVAEDDNADVSARKRRAMWKSTKIISSLETEILPQLYRFITSDKKGDAPGRKSEIRVGDLTAEKAISSGQSKLNDNRAITQLPVAVAIAKIVRLFPEESFKMHIEQLLHEIVLKLRTKNDKQRESARKVLCSVMREIGPNMLKFVVTKLKDNFVHGYQLHVLGYTVVTVLYSMYAPASPYAMISRKQSKEMAKASKKAAANTHSAADSDDDDAHSDGDEAAMLHPSLLPSFDEAAGKLALKDSTDVLFDIFMDDYLGEIGAQKEQIELMSTIPEVKRSRALQGFIFLATHCDAADAMARFVHKIAWVLAPPTATELLKKGGIGGVHVVGTNTKYVAGGEKNSIADSKFVNKVRFLGLRVARALMTNRSLDVASSLDTVRNLIHRHNAVREEKIARFEAKDGTRRIRGNWAAQIGAQRKTTKERYEENFTVAQRPERIDVDVNASTVLVGSATQQKQKLRVYRGRYAKDLSEAGRGFAAEDSEAAVVLDTLDEFCLKFLLSVLKRVLGIGKEMKLGKLPLPATTDEEEDSAQKDANGKAAEEQDPEEQEEDEEEGLVTDEQVEGELDHEDNEALEAAGDAEQLDDLGALCEAQRQEEEQNLATRSTRRQKKTAASSFTAAYKPLLESTVPVILAALEGEGSDTVVSHALDVLHALLALRPPLDAINTLGKTIFDTIVLFFIRGGVIKQRALRVVAAVVQHKRYQLRDDDAARLVALVRTELIDSTEFVPNALLVLHAVLSKRAMVEEVYDIISVVTETMMHWSHAPVIRMRSVSVLVKFLTEYKLTREKLKSHVDLYVRNLPYANSTSQLALLELLDLLISRFPTEILREEAQVIFVPLVGLLCRCENRDTKEKAASVMGHLVVHAGIASIEPILDQWLKGKSISVRTSAYQALAVCIPCLTAYYDKDELLAMFRFASSAIVGGCMTHEGEVLTKKEREAKRQREEDDAKAEVKRATLSKKAKVQADTKVWQPVFFALRCVEALVDVHPIAAFAMCGGQLVQHVFVELLEHTHPWVKAAAMRIAMKYLYQCVEPQSGYLVCAVPGNLSTTAPTTTVPLETMPLVCHIKPTAAARSTCIDAEQQLARCSKFLKRVLATVPAHDVANEKYEANRAIEEPLRANTVKVVLYLVKVVVQLTLALLGSRAQHAEHLLSHYASIWQQVTALAQPALEHHRIDGYVVRVATLAQIVGGLIALLPTAAAAGSADDGNSNTPLARNALLVIAQVTPAMMYHTVVPLVASSMESTFDKLSAIGAKVCDAIRNELQRRSSEFGAAPSIRPDAPDASQGKQKKKLRAEQHSTSQYVERIAVEDVIVQLTKVADEIRSHSRDTETKKQARKAVKRSRTEEAPRSRR